MGDRLEQCVPEPLSCDWTGLVIQTPSSHEADAQHGMTAGVSVRGGSADGFDGGQGGQLQRCGNPLSISMQPLQKCNRGSYLLGNDAPDERQQQRELAEQVARNQRRRLLFCIEAASANRLGKNAEEPVLEKEKQRVQRNGSPAKSPLLWWNSLFQSIGCHGKPRP